MTSRDEAASNPVIASYKRNRVFVVESWRKTKEGFEGIEQGGRPEKLWKVLEV